MVGDGFVPVVIDIPFKSYKKEDHDRLKRCRLYDLLTLKDSFRFRPGFCRNHGRLRYAYLDTERHTSSLLCPTRDSIV